MSEFGPVGRLGRWTATHTRAVFAGWAVLLVVMGIFAPRVEQALSGAGWEASGSESVEARTQINANFGGASSYALQVVVHADDATLSDPSFRSTVSSVERELADHPDVAGTIGPIAMTSATNQRRRQ